MHIRPRLMRLRLINIPERQESSFARGLVRRDPPALMLPAVSLGK
jgi:hypothetical protein